MATEKAYADRQAVLTRTKSARGQPSAKPAPAAGLKPALIVLFLGITGVAVYGFSTRIFRNVTLPSAQLPSVTPFPSVKKQDKQIVKLPAGRQVYTFMHGKNTVGPVPDAIELDPLTPAKNQQQTVTLHAKHSQPVDTAVITVTTDNSSEEHALSRTELTASGSTWQGSWILRDSYTGQYAMTIRLNGTNASYNETMRFR